ncbi:MAG: DNA internalization-related competence protein ComEC/Rec2 [Candidatus Thiodiazotropha sp.]
MNLVLICFVLGATLFHQLQTLPSAWWFAAFAPLVVFWRYPRIRPLLALFAGAGWSLLFATAHLQNRLPAELEGEDLVVEAVITSLPSVHDRLVRFQVDVDKLHDSQGNPLAVSRLQLSWYNPFRTIHVGDRWRLKVRLKRPRGAQNPTGTNIERWLFTQGIGARGYVRKWHHNKRLNQQPEWAWIDRLRQRIAARIEGEVDTQNSASLLNALAVGDKRGFGVDDWRVFSLTGTNHLVAISGLHIGIVAGWILFLGQWLWRRSERLTLSLPALKAGSVAALVGAFCYAALAGFSLPTQRALLMLATTLGSVLLGRRITPGRSLVQALFLVVLLDPMATLSAGFWLSFGAVAVILWSLGGRISPWNGWRQMLRVQWFVTLGLLPLLFLFFGQASLISLLVNLIMVPWFTLVLVPLVLMGLPLLAISPLAGWWFGLLGWMTGLTYQLLVWFSQLPYASITLPDVAVWIWVAALFGFLLWLLPAGIPGRGLALCLVAPLFLAQPPRPAHGELWFTLLDVGQGLACVIETENHLMVYDTGPAYVSGFSAAESVLIPYLRARGHKQIDLLIVSNNDMDHAGGYTALKRAIPIADTLSGEAEQIQQARSCEAGESWDWDGVTFTLLHPGGDERFAHSNDRSCVVQVSIEGRRILLPGDIGAAGERSLLARYAGELKSEIVVAPHHGSASSSSEQFVSTVDPDWVLISSGYGNSYGFPKDVVIRRWLNQGAVILNSAESGAIEFRLGKKQAAPTPRLYRRYNNRYWND